MLFSFLRRAFKNCSVQTLVSFTGLAPSDPEALVREVLDAFPLREACFRLESRESHDRWAFRQLGQQILAIKIPTETQVHNQRIHVCTDSSSLCVVGVRVGVHLGVTGCWCFEMLYAGTVCNEATVVDGKGRLITFLYLRPCECFSHAPIVEVVRLLQDDSGPQM